MLFPTTLGGSYPQPEWLIDRSGPFTMSQQAQNEFYKTDAEYAMNYAAAVNEEIRNLFAAGADMVQVDEPYMQARPEKAGKGKVKRCVKR